MKFVIVYCVLTTVVLSGSWLIAGNCQWSPAMPSTLPGQLNMPICSGGGPSITINSGPPPCSQPSCFVSVTVSFPFDTDGGYNSYLEVGDGYDFDGWRWFGGGTTTASVLSLSASHTAACNEGSEYVQAQQVVWCYDSQGNLEWLDSVWKAWALCKDCTA